MPQLGLTAVDSFCTLVVFISYILKAHTVYTRARFTDNSVNAALVRVGTTRGIGQAGFNLSPEIGKRSFSSLDYFQCKISVPLQVLKHHPSLRRSMLAIGLTIYNNSSHQYTTSAQWNITGRLLSFRPR